MAYQRLRRALLKTVLTLPAPVLRAAVGGGVVWRGGRTLDPRVQVLWKSRGDPRTLSEVAPDEARRGWAALVRDFGLRPRAEVRQETVLLDGPANVITTRLFTPPEQDFAAPMLVFFHEGAGVVGDPEAAEGFAALIAETARCPVLVPEYRLAPEHRFPAGLEDAEAAYRWAAANASRYGASGAAVGGEGVGAGFAAAICLMLKAEDEPQPAAQLLVCPMLDAAARGGSMDTYGGAWPLSKEGLAWALEHYVGAEADPADPRLSPLRADDLGGLAPAVIAAAGFDPLLDQAEAYARRLKADGTPVSYRCWDALPHGFPALAGVTPAAERACREVAELLRAAATAA